MQQKWLQLILHLWYEELKISANNLQMASFNQSCSFPIKLELHRINNCVASSCYIYMHVGYIVHVVISRYYYMCVLVAQ